MYYGLTLIDSGVAGSAGQGGAPLCLANSNRAAENSSRPVSVISSQPDVGHARDGGVKYVSLTILGMNHF